MTLFTRDPNLPSRPGTETEEELALTARRQQQRQVEAQVALTTGTLTVDNAVQVVEARGGVPDLGGPLFVTSSEASEFGITIPADWQVKVTPVAGADPDVRFVVPDRGELTLQEVNELVRLQNEAAALGFEQQELVAAAFPQDADTQAIIQGAVDDPEDFLTSIRELGDTEETRALLASVFPDATGTQIHDLFYLPQSIEDDVRATYNLSPAASPENVQTFFETVTSDANTFNSGLLKRSFESPEQAEAAESLYRSLNPNATDEQVRAFFQFNPGRQITPEEAGAIRNVGLDEINAKYRAMAAVDFGIPAEELGGGFSLANRFTLDQWLMDNPDEAAAMQRETGVVLFQWNLDTSEDFTRSFLAGIEDVRAAAGGAARWLGLDGVAASLSTNAGDMRQFAPVAVGFEGWGSFANPRFYTTTVTRALPFVISLVPAGLIGMGAGAATAGFLGLGAIGTAILEAIGVTALTRPLEASLEAGGAFDAALDSGFSQEDANKAATQVFQQNLALAGVDVTQFAVAFLPAPFKTLSNLVRKGWVTTVRLAGKIAITGVTEAGEEAVQEIIKRSALDLPIVLDDELKTAMAVGGIFGIGLGGGGDVLSQMLNNTVEALPVDLKRTYDEGFAKAKREGVTDDQTAAYIALNEVVQTETGKAIIDREVQLQILREQKTEVVAKSEVEQTGWDKFFDDKMDALPPIVEAVGTPPAGFREVQLTDGRQVFADEGLSDFAVNDLVESGAIEIGDQQAIDDETTRRIEEVEGRKFGLEQTLAEDPVAQMRVQITGRQVSLTHFISLREQSFPGHFTLKQGLQLNPGLNVGRFSQKGTKLFNKVPRDEALDRIVKELTETTGNQDLTADDVADRVEQIRAEQRELRELTAQAFDIYEEATAPVPETGLTPEQTVEVAQTAANIRLGKFSPEVQPLISEWVEANGLRVVEATRGVVSDAAVRADAENLAETIGADVEAFRRRWSAGTTFNAEELVAVRGVLETKTREVFEAQQRAQASNTSENLLRLEIALREQASIQEIVHGVTAEAGRALRSFRQSAEDVLKSGDQKAIEDILTRLGGRLKTEQAAELLSQLDINDPTAVHKFILGFSKPSLADKIFFVWFNSILSGPRTHLRNAISNFSTTILSPIERATAAAIEVPLSAFQGRPRARFFNEVPADVFGAIRGLPEGVRHFAFTVKNGFPPVDINKLEVPAPAFGGPIGRVIGAPSALLQAADALGFAVNFNSALNVEAHRAASIEGLKGQPFENRVAELLADPPAEMYDDAVARAKDRLFQRPVGEFGQALMKMRDSVKIGGLPILRFPIPFVRITINLAKFGLERTPVGFLNPQLIKNLAAKDPKAADQLAAIFVGSTIIGALATYAIAGFITGAPPKDRSERDRFYREGKQPFAIRVGDHWFSYQSVEPWNVILGFAAGIGEGIRNDEADPGEQVVDFALSFARNFVDQSYMAGLSDIMDAIAEPERHAGKWWQRWVTSLMPFSSALRTAAQVADPVIRDPQNLWEALKANIPGLSTSVQPKITALGEDIERKGPAWFPVNITPVEETLLTQELERLEFNIGFVGGTISGMELTESEQRDLQKLTGQTIKADLEQLMLSPEYWVGNDVQREKMLNSVTTAARNWARAETRQAIWAAGSTEERLEVLNTALVVSDDLLGTVISAAPEFTTRDPDVYTIDKELDASYTALLAGIEESALTDIETPPTVSSWYVKEQGVEDSALEPDKPQYKIDQEDLPNLLNQWEARSRIGDERALTEFDAEHPDAKLGDMTRREVDLLEDYYAAEDRDAFLEANPSLKVNDYQNWLRGHPEANANMALWGDAPLASVEAYNLYKGLITSLDIVDSALPDFTLPPDGTIKTHFAYVELSSEGKHNSWEAQLLLAQDDEYRIWRELQPVETPIASLEIKTGTAYRDTHDAIQAVSNPESADFIAEDATVLVDGEKVSARDAERDRLRANPVSGEQFRDAERRVEAIEQGTNDDPVADEIVTGWVERGKVVDEHGGGSQEAKLFWLDNPNVHAWALDNELVTTSMEDLLEREQIIRLDVRLAPMDTQYEAIQGDTVEGTQAERREAFLENNTEYADDRRRRTAHEFGIADNLVESYVEYYNLTDKGFARDRFRLQNAPLDVALTDASIMGDNALVAVDPATIPDVEHDRLLALWDSQIVDYEDTIPESHRTVSDTATRTRLIEDDRQDLFKANPGFEDDYLRFQGYGKFIQNQFVEDYVAYYKLDTAGFARDRYLKERPGFYEEMRTKLEWTGIINFAKVQSERFEEAFNTIYEALPKGAPRLQYRGENLWFDKEGVALGKWQPYDSRGFTPTTEAQRIIDETERRLAQLEEDALTWR